MPDSGPSLGDSAVTTERTVSRSSQSQWGETDSKWTNGCDCQGLVSAMKKNKESEGQ